MLLVAAGLLCAVLATGAALLSLEQCVARAGGMIARRIALSLLLASLVVLVLAAALTLNLRGSGTEADADDATPTHLALRRAAGPLAPQARKAASSAATSSGRWS